MPARRQRKQKQKSRQERVFHLFGQLPTELRLEIWTHTWAPRTVTLYPIGDGIFLRPRGGNLLPASGYVNSESRSETLRYYKRCFDHGDETDFRWFNFRLDTLCIATNSIHLDELNLAELRQLQRLIVHDDLSGMIRAATPCRNTWPKPITESFKSADVEENLQDYYPNLREVTLTANIWLPFGVGNRYTLFRHDSIPGWCYMRTVYIGKLKIRYSPVGKKTDRQRYGCRLSKEEVDLFLQMMVELLVHSSDPEPDDSLEPQS